MPAPFTCASDPRVMALVGASVAPSAWNGHGKAWLEWLHLAEGLEQRGREELLGTTLQYLIQLREKGCSASVAQKRLSGVRFHLLLRGCVDVTKDFLICQALKGWRKEEARRESRRPISFAILQRIIASLHMICSSDYEYLLFKLFFV